MVFSNSLLAFIIGFVMLLMAIVEVFRPSVIYSVVVVHAFLAFIVYNAGVHLSRPVNASYT